MFGIKVRAAAVTIATAAFAVAGGAWAATSAWQGDPPITDGGGWKIADIGAATVVVIDSDGIERRGDEARAWVAVLFLEPQKDEGRTVAILMARNSYDCRTGTWKTVSKRQLDEAGRVVSGGDVIPGQPKVAEDLQAKLLKAVCEPASLDGDKMTDLVVARDAFVKVMTR